MSEKKTLSDFLAEHKAEEPISFHMPGHKGREELFVKCGYADFAREMIGNDITEIPGADNLFDPKKRILEIMDAYRELYSAKHTELLINGSSAGLMASVLSVVPRGNKLILGRNSHHSVFSAMRLGGIAPVYLRPEIDKATGMQTFISPEELEDAISENPDAKAVLITSPNYYGVLSDIKSLAKICHESGMLLIVDEAHGAHLSFFDRGSERKRAAENLGADIVICSTHKTLLSFTGSGLLHVFSDEVDVDALADTLRMLQTTSPSYLLMGSLDVNAGIMKDYGNDIVRSWREDLEYFYRRARNISGLEVFIHDMLDPTKINISMSALGLDGEELGRELRYNNIWVEMVHGDYVMLMTGAGNRRSDYRELLRVLEIISSNYGVGSKKREHIEHSDPVMGINDVPLKSERVPLYLAEGRVMSTPVIIYPPGYPVVCPGEIINLDAIKRISRAMSNGESIVGVDEEGRVSVGKEDA